MANVTFIQPDGEKVALNDVEGNLMELAREHNVEGIEGDCGGVCSCSTCHVFISPEWMDKVGSAEEHEADTLEFDDRRREGSRLSCQIELTTELDGLEVTVAPPQE